MQKARRDAELLCDQQFCFMQKNDPFLGPFRCTSCGIHFYQTLELKRIISAPLPLRIQQPTALLPQEVDRQRLDGGTQVGVRHGDEGE